MRRVVHTAISVLSVVVIIGGTDYAVGRERLRDTDLKRYYQKVNRESFREELPPATVEWGYLDDAYGRTYFEDETKIVIDRAAVTSEKQLHEVMAHEMCHVATQQAINDGEGDHGPSWTACMERFK